MDAGTAQPLCVMGAGTAWQLTVGWLPKVIQKCVSFVKISRSAIRLFEGSQLADFYVTVNFICIIVLLLIKSEQLSV